MRRFALAIIVGLLTLSASGVLSLVVQEPCTGYEQTGDDGTCPPTCVTCGCCAQAAEPGLLAGTDSPDAPIADIIVHLSAPLKAEPRDILHVPKPRLA